MYENCETVAQNLTQVVYNSGVMGIINRSGRSFCVRDSYSRDTSTTRPAATPASSTLNLLRSKM